MSSGHSSCRGVRGGGAKAGLVGGQWGSSRGLVVPTGERLSLWGAASCPAHTGRGQPGASPPGSSWPAQWPAPSCPARQLAGSEGPAGQSQAGWLGGLFFGLHPTLPSGAPRRSPPCSTRPSPLPSPAPTTPISSAIRQRPPRASPKRTPSRWNGSSARCSGGGMRPYTASTRSGGCRERCRPLRMQGQWAEQRESGKLGRWPRQRPTTTRPIHPPGGLERRLRHRACPRQQGHARLPPKAQQLAAEPLIIGQREEQRL